MRCVYQAHLSVQVLRTLSSLHCVFMMPVHCLVTSQTPVANWNELQFAASETLFASSWSCFSSSEDAMEYSKEFVTAVVLGKDLVPRQVEKSPNSLMSICCSVPVTYFQSETPRSYLSCFLIYLSVSASHLSSWLPAPFTWTPTLVFYIPFYRHIPLHLSVACMK